MEDSRIGTAITALPLVIMILALVIALYNTGFDVEAATLPENPVGPLEETLTSIFEADGPLVSGISVESDPDAGTVTLKGSVKNPTSHPMTILHLIYRIPGAEGGFVASLPAPVQVPPGGNVAVVLTGPATVDAVYALKSGSADGALSLDIEMMGINISTEMTRPWKVER